MERIKKKIAKNVQERADLEAEGLKQTEADKEVELLNERRAEVKLQAQLDYEAHKLEKQKEQELKNEANTPEARMRKADRYATMITDREIYDGLTKEQRAYKHLNSKERIECNNMIANGEVKDIHGYLKKRRQKQEASNKRRKYLKGL
ncbi:hypothetical protein ES705_32254 [subsurface metagenome]